MEETLSYILTSLHRAPREVFLLTWASLHSCLSLPTFQGEVSGAPETWLLWALVPLDAAEKGGGWDRILRSYRTCCVMVSCVCSVRGKLGVENVVPGLQ